jgi:hypothetical protein
MLRQVHGPRCETVLRAIFRREFEIGALFAPKFRMQRGCGLCYSRLELREIFVRDIFLASFDASGYFSEFGKLAFI